MDNSMASGLTCFIVVRNDFFISCDDLFVHVFINFLCSFAMLLNIVNC